MRCQQMYYEGDKGYLCWLDKQPCDRPDQRICQRIIKYREKQKKGCKNV